MPEETLRLANDFGLWVCAAVTVALVFVQSALYIRMSYKEAAKIGMPKAMLNKSFKVGLTTGFGPGVANAVVLVSLIGFIGLPISWMRLSIIGAAPSELTATTTAATVMGVQLGSPEYTPEALSLAFFTMGINVCGWLLMCTFFTHKMEDIRIALGGGDTKWLNLITAGASVGVFGNLAAQQCVGGTAKLAGCVAAAAAMFVLNQYLCPKVKGLSEWTIAICMVVSMVVGTVVAGFAG